MFKFNNKNTRTMSATYIVNIFIHIVNFEQVNVSQAAATKN